ncbi:MAG: glycosyltransferase family 4 protein, partial [Actinomycetota bacterium]|nr:glycosyltransferase family 4 protein [Actinomycetota bacterium]
RVLLWHGYLMSGTGSNIYTANVARSWKRSGHDVLVMCQEPHPERFGFVDGFVTLGPANAAAELSGSASGGEGGGRCVVVRPYIGDLLPVYVLDAYEGIEAKTFVDLTDDELARYTSLNIEALRSVIDEFSPDAIITGHEVMGPYIAREACEQTGATYVAKLHGSALEYAVKLQDRYRRFGADGLNAARYVIGGSRYMIDAASGVLPGWENKAKVVNPGCDVDLFRPIARPGSDKLRVGYVGKLIASKGVDHLLAALPLLEREAEVVIVGFGGNDEQLRSLWAALHRGDRDAALTIAGRGDIGAHRSLREFLERQPQTYFQRAQTIDVRFPGRLDHGPLSKVLPTFDVLVAPSVVPEAFGMVAAEAAACGVLPVVPRHSGIGEAGAVLEAELDLEGALIFDPADPIAGIAGAVNGLLALPEAERRQKGAEAATVARRLWSWDVVAAKLLELAAP